MPPNPSQISTHAPRVGSDSRICKSRVVQQHFNSRSPCGERQMLNTLISSLALFQLTLPVWGATSGVQIAGRLRTISTHAPRVGSDQLGIIRRIIGQISTHAPRVGSDGETPAVDLGALVFQLTLPVWGATHWALISSGLPVFQLTLPVWGATITAIISS